MKTLSVILFVALVVGLALTTRPADAKYGGLQDITIEVPGKSGRHWIDTGIDLKNGSSIQIAASGRVNFGREGTFGPRGVWSRSIEPGFPADMTVNGMMNRYGLVIRLTSSRTNPDDELREDYLYTSTSISICARNTAHVWLTVNDNEPDDNIGSFFVNIGTGGTCAATDTRVRSTTIHVVDERYNNVAGAEVYVNGERVGVTGNDGTLISVPLNNSEQIIARKLIAESVTYRNSHSQGSSRNWNYRTYLTTLSVNDDGNVSPHVVRDANETQELVLRRRNTLVGVHLVASVEWDATRAELDFYKNELKTMSQFLYNATDGQFFIERIDLYDDARYWDDTDFRIFANLNIRPYVNLRRGGFKHSGLGTWMNMRRPPGVTTDSWSSFKTFAHEFGHYGFDLGDEYADNDGSVYCATNVNARGGDFGADQPRASCIMSTQFRAGKLCSNNTANPHRHGTNQGDESCWTHLANEYRDNNSPSRWTIQTPDTRAVIVGSLPELLEGWQAQINVENRNRGYDATASLCRPFAFRVTDSAGRPVDRVDVWLRTFYGQNILQGTTGWYESGGGIVDLGSGTVPITGAHIGDRISAGGRDYVIGESDCLQTTRRRDDFSENVQFVRAASSNYVGGQQRSQSRTVDLRLPEETVPMFASIESVDNSGQLVIRVRTDSPFRSAPKAQVTTSGSTNPMSIGMRYDATTQTYLSDPFKLPVGTYASVALTGTNDSGQETTKLFNFVLSPINGEGQSEIFSADGQLSVSVPTRALPENAAVIVGPSSTTPPKLDAGYKIVSGPFRVNASTSNSMRERGVVRFQFPNLRDGRTPDGLDANTFQVLRYNDQERRWDVLPSTFLPTVDVITVATDQLGDYLVIGRVRNAVPLRDGIAASDPAKREEQTAPVKFSVTAATLKANESLNAGVCPVTVKFSGSITTNGAGSVRYRFVRSDGATGPVEFLDFSEAATKDVQTTWILGGPGLLTYEGWEAVEIIGPNPMESNRATAKFTLSCSAPADPAKQAVATTDALKIKADLQVEGSPLSGQCPLTVNFVGFIATNGPGQVKFVFTRNDGATSQVQILDFKEAGSQKVSTSWMIGDAKGLPHYEGWQAIKILSPVEFESAAAKFVIDCKQQLLARLITSRALFAHAQKRTDPALESLADTLRALGNHKIFLDLLESAGQGFPIGLPRVSNTDTSKTGQYTILAPTDEAFAQLPAGVVEKLKSDPTRLRQFLLGFFIPKKLMIADMLIPSANNPGKTLFDVKNAAGVMVSFQCDTHSGEHHPRINTNARIGKGDILFNGGVIHEIDQVLHINPFQ